MNFPNLQLNSTLGLTLYWFPLAFCVFGYFVRALREFKKERAEREGGTAYFSPQLTIGTLLGWALVSIMPVANLFASVFDLAPGLFGRFFDWVSAVFNTPLVPDSKEFEAARDAKRRAKVS